MKRSRLAIAVRVPTTGGVEVPFSATCVVNRRPFAGKVTVTWSRLLRVPEFDALARLVMRKTRRATTCEDLAHDVREALRRDFRRGLVVRVDVTNESHVRAWAVVE